MTTCLGKSWSFSLLYASLVNVYQFVLVSFPFGFEGGMWDLIELVPDHCLSFYFTLYNQYSDPNKMAMNISAKVQNFRP